MRTTKHSNNLLVALLIGAVNLCAAYSIKEPGTYTASFSKSSSSASAFSQSSSSSYTVNGNVAPGDVESLKEVLKSGAIAHASAGAAAGTVAGATASAGAVASANAESVADGTDRVIVDGFGHQQGVTASAGSNVKGSGCSRGSSCGKDKSSNSITDSSSASDSGSYKVIGSDKYATGYSNGDSTNYAVSGQYVQPAQNAEGCISCKGPFPGPNGSIHTYKPAISNPHSAPAPVVQPIASTSGPLSHQHEPAVINNLPGPSGSIYQSKPASGYSGQSATEAQTQYNSGHVSPELVATLPGPSGSIYDSKPVSAIASAGAYADTGVASAHPQVVPAHPQVVQPSAVPSCTDSNCGSNPSLSDIIAILPGPSGSIHESKPASGVISTSHQASGSSSDSYSTSGSVSHSPAAPVARPSCSFASGSGPTNCAGNSASEANSAYSGAGSVTYNPYTHPPSDASKHTSGSTIASNSTSSTTHNGVYNGAGSVTNIPASHPVVGPVCNYSPGSPNKCASSGSSTAHTEAGSGATSEYEAGSEVLTPSIHPQLPSPGTYYVNKPTSDIEPPHVSPAHSFAGQIPCSDRNCGNIQKGASPTHQGDCGSAGGCGVAAATSQGSASSGIIYDTKDTNTQYSSTNYDAAHISGGVVFQNEDGSYSNVPEGTRPIYKNSAKGGYAVSSNAADNTGVLIGPGTGHLPIEAEHKPFGTQGSFGGSEALNEKTNSDKVNSFASSSAIAHSSEHTTTSNTGLGTDVTIQKVDGTVVTPVDTTFNQSPCVVDGSCGNTNVLTDIGTGYINAPSSASSTGNGYHNIGISTSGSAAETGYSNVGTSVTSGLETGYNNVPTSTIVTNTINNNAAASTSGLVAGIDYNHIPIPSSGSTTGTGHNNAGASTISGSHSGTGYIKATASSTESDSINTLINTSDYNKGSSASSSSVTGTGYNTAAISSSGSLPGTSYTNVEHDHKQSGTPIKLNCAGPFCKPGSTQVYIIEERPQYGHRHHGDDSGYATGQVLINQGQNGLDITNSGSHGFGGNYAGSNGGSYFPPVRGYSNGCGAGKCGAFGGYGGSYHKPASSYSTAAGGGYGIPTSGAFLDGLLGKGGLSGNIFNGGASQAAAYSSSGAYGGASAGSYASAGAGASASAGAYAGSY